MRAAGHRQKSSIHLSVECQALGCVLYRQGEYPSAPETIWLLSSDSESLDSEGYLHCIQSSQQPCKAGAVMPIY